MSNSLNGSGLRDNHSRGSAGGFLQGAIQPGSELSFVSAYFTVHAYAALKDSLESADHLRFLFGEPSSVTSLEKDKKEGRRFILGNERQELTLGNQLTQKQVARECAAWIRSKVAIRSVTRSGFLHGKLYHIAMQDGNYPTAISVIEFAKRLCTFQDKVNGLVTEWNELEDLQDASTPEVREIVSKRFFGRRKKGEITPSATHRSASQQQLPFTKPPPWGRGRAS